MGQIGADNEPLHEQAGYVWDGSDWVKQPLTPTVAQSQSYVWNGSAWVQEPLERTVTQANAYGYDGAAWQKQPLIFGFTDRLYETVYNSSLSAGTNTLTGTSVPSGEIWVVTTATLRYIGTPPTVIYALPTFGGSGVALGFTLTPTSGQGYQVGGPVYLKAGDHYDAAVEGATAGDVYLLYYVGYKMEVA